MIIHSIVDAEAGPLLSIPHAGNKTPDEGYQKWLASGLRRSRWVIAVCVALFCGLMAGNLLQQNGFLINTVNPMIRLRGRGSVQTYDGYSFGYSRQQEKQRSNLLLFKPLSGRDIIVFIQIQNAGANQFEKHLAYDTLPHDKPCGMCPLGSSVSHEQLSRCRCSGMLKRGVPSWLFSRLSGGWRMCETQHPDWTELHACVDRALDELNGESPRRRYLYITILRDPIKRFRSEWLHFNHQRANGRLTQRSKRRKDWKCGASRVAANESSCSFRSGEQRFALGVSLENFAACSSNPARNRQTSMLADLRLVDCYGDTTINETERNMILLHSAKNNLRRMAFFGLAEFPNVSQLLFEAVFGIRFTFRPYRRFSRLSSYLRRHGFYVGPQSRYQKSNSHDPDASSTEAAVRQANSLDSELYEYAKRLLFERFHRLFRDRDMSGKMWFSVADEGEVEEDSEWVEGEEFFLYR